MRAAHAKCLQSGKFLIGAEIASGIDVMNGISRQPMGKFGKPPSPFSSPRAIGIKIPGEVGSADENHCRNYGTFKISIKNDCENEREKIEVEMENVAELRDEAIYLIFRTISTFAPGRGKRTLGTGRRPRSWTERKMGQRGR